MFSKFKLILNATSRITSSKSIKPVVLKLSPLMLRSSGIATSVVKRSHDEPFDPILELLYEDYLKAESETESGSKMLTKDPPITSLDLDGKPIEPIDINPWLDDNELKYLMSDSSYERNKVIGSKEVHRDAGRSILHLANANISDENIPDAKNHVIDLEDNRIPEE